MEGERSMAKTKAKKELKKVTLEELKEDYCFRDSDEVMYEEDGNEVVVRIPKLSPEEESKRFWASIDEGIKGTELENMTLEEINKIIKAVRAEKRAERIVKQKA